MRPWPSRNSSACWKPSTPAVSISDWGDAGDSWSKLAKEFGEVRAVAVTPN